MPKKKKAIITIAYKWASEENVEVLTWDKGDDNKLIREFVKVMAEADELVGHNVDRFDTKFIMARALKHEISVLPKYQSTDTLKLAKKHFLLNSNKLDYIDISPEYGVMEIAVGQKFSNKTLGELHLRDKYGITVMVIKSEEKILVGPGANDVVRMGDVLVAVGKNSSLQKVLSRME